jgi:hypothetical protein
MRSSLPVYNALLENPAGLDAAIRGGSAVAAAPGRPCGGSWPQ